MCKKFISSILGGGPGGPGALAADPNSTKPKETPAAIVKVEGLDGNTPGTPKKKPIAEILGVPGLGL